MFACCITCYFFHSASLHHCITCTEMHCVQWAINMQHQHAASHKRLLLCCAKWPRLCSRQDLAPDWHLCTERLLHSLHYRMNCIVALQERSCALPRFEPGLGQERGGQGTLLESTVKTGEGNITFIVIYTLLGMDRYHKLILWLDKRYTLLALIEQELLRCTSFPIRTRVFKYRPPLCLDVR